MNERGWLTVEELVNIIENEVKNKKITVRDADYILIRVQQFVDSKGRKDQNRYKSVNYKFGTKW